MLKTHQYLIIARLLQGLLNMTLPSDVTAKYIVLTPDSIAECLGKLESVILLSSLMWHLSQTMRICFDRDRPGKLEGWGCPLSKTDKKDIEFVDLS